MGFILELGGGQPKTKESKGKKETITLWCTNVGLKFAEGLRILEKKKEKKYSSFKKFCLRVENVNNIFSHKVKTKI